MTGLQPLRGALVRPERAAEVVSPAFDAMTAEERRAYRTAHPLSYLNVTRSAGDETDADTVSANDLANRGRQALDMLLDAQVFVDLEEPAFLIYEIDAGAHRQRGLVGEFPGAAFAKAAQPHEATRAGRAALLAEHLKVVQAMSSPVAATVRDQGALAGLLAVATDELLLDYTPVDDGARQRVWSVDAAHADAVASLVAELPEVFIVDGHHRAEANANLLADDQEVPILLALFPVEELNLLGFHRLVRLPPGLDEQQLIDRVGRRFRVEPVAGQAETPASGTVHIFAAGGWWRVTFDERPVTGSGLVLRGALDPAVVERELLGGVVGHFGDLDVEYQADTVGLDAVLDRCRREHRVPILVAPLEVEDMFTVAAAGEVLPAKSTYFTPKVRSGIFLRSYRER